MERFNSNDLGKGYKICSTCKINVFILKEGYDIKKFKACKTCGNNSVTPIEVFFNTEVSK